MSDEGVGDLHRAKVIFTTSSEVKTYGRADVVALDRGAGHGRIDGLPIELAWGEAQRADTARAIMRTKANHVVLVLNKAMPHRKLNRAIKRIREAGRTVSVFRLPAEGATAVRLGADRLAVEIEVDEPLYPVHAPSAPAAELKDDADPVHAPSVPRPAPESKWSTAPSTKTNS
jgi:hypothetical protein